MDKKRLIDQIVEHLNEELAALKGAARAAHDAATHAEAKQEDAYDTRAIEAAYLAGAQSKRVKEIEQTILMYRFLPVREYSDVDAACPGAIIELKHKDTRAFYFIVPSGGGLITSIDGNAVQVITPKSPMGEALLGRKVGEVVEVELRGSIREYELVSVR